jgi:hypothetical protein
MYQDLMFFYLFPNRTRDSLMRRASAREKCMRSLNAEIIGLGNILSEDCFTDPLFETDFNSRVRRLGNPERLTKNLADYYTYLIVLRKRFREIR